MWCVTLVSTPCMAVLSSTHDQKLSVLKAHNMCLNCLGPGHFVRNCQSNSHCQRCQKPHHTLLHVESRSEEPPPPTSATPTSEPRDPPAPVSSHTAVGSLLLMTCNVLAMSPNGSSMQARALLDGGSSVSFVSERLTQCLRL